MTSLGEIRTNQIETMIKSTGFENKMLKKLIMIPEYYQWHLTVTTV